MRNWGIGMIVGGWLLLGGMVWLAMDSWMEARYQPNAHLARDAVRLAEEVVLRRDAAGHYIAPGKLNGVDVTFLVDTGATNVALPSALAGRIGALPGSLVHTRTANGNAVAYATRLHSVWLGGLEAHDVAGTIIPDMQGSVVLLGMSFLSRFAISMGNGEMLIQIAR